MLKATKLTQKPIYHRAEAEEVADISYARRLCLVFRAVIIGAIDELRAVLGDSAVLVIETIDAHIQCLFVQVQ